MKPADVAINLGTPQGSPRTSSDFEEVHYPHQHTSAASISSTGSLGWTTVPRREEELPLPHYMSEDTARRRVPRAPAVGDGSGTYAVHDEKQALSYDAYDDGGKDVYAKMKAARGPVGSGRVRRPPPPPPTSIVCVYTIFSLPIMSDKTAERVHSSKLRTYRPYHLYPPFLLDTIPQNRQVKYCCLG